MYFSSGNKRTLYLILLDIAVCSSTLATYQAYRIRDATVWKKGNVDYAYIHQIDEYELLKDNYAIMAIVADEHAIQMLAVAPDDPNLPSEIDE